MSEQPEHANECIWYEDHGRPWHEGECDCGLTEESQGGTNYLDWLLDTNVISALDYSNPLAKGREFNYGSEHAV